MTRVALLLCFVFMALARPVLAHDSQPLLVEVKEQAPRLYRVQTKLPPSLQDRPAPGIELAPDCSRLDSSTGAPPLPGKPVLIRCAHPLPGGSVKVVFADYNPSLAMIFRFEPLAGPVLTQLQSPDQPVWQVPAPDAQQAAPWHDTALRYGKLGVEHILFGFDHLLFVICLMILAGSRHRILLAITGFTVAHSLTLGLAALGVFRPPGVVIEALIALSIIILATEIVRHDKTTLAWRYPMAISMVFGLLHGFGFAAVLGEIGLPPDQELLSLFSFNLGVEVGQLLFVIATVLLVTGIGALVSRFGKSGAPPTALPATPIAYAVGALASFWLIQRVTLF